MLGPSGIAPVALAQLAAWQQVAAVWPLRIGHDHLRCAQCGVPVIAVADASSVPYRLTVDQIRDGTVRHLRESHPEVQPPGVLGDMIAS